MKDEVRSKHPDGDRLHLSWSLLTICIFQRSQRHGYRCSSHNQARRVFSLFIEKEVYLGNKLLFFCYFLGFHQGNIHSHILISCPTHLFNSIATIPSWPGVLVLLLSFVSLAESWYCNRSVNHHPCERGGDRFLKALYEPRDLYHDQEASEVQTRSVFISWSFSLWDLDVHCFCLHWGQCSFIPGQQI